MSSCDDDFFLNGSLTQAAALAPAVAGWVPSGSVVVW